MQAFEEIIEKNKGNIWRYQAFYPSIPQKTHLSLGEGSTSIERVGEVIFKREDQNPSGSVKDRGFAFQFSKALREGADKFVLSSSGNAAISASMFAEKFDLDLTVFISPRIEEKKKERLEGLSVSLKVSEKPVRDAALFARREKAQNLRQSYDDSAVVGYNSLGYELFEDVIFNSENKERFSIFTPVSSATTFVGIGKAFKELKDRKFFDKMPQLHVVQTEYINPIAREFDLDAKRKTGLNPGELGMAKALCAPKTVRKEEAVDLIKDSHGSAWIVSDKEIESAWDWLDEEGLKTSAEGAAALAGLRRAEDEGWVIGKPICILTGKDYTERYD